MQVKTFIKRAFGQILASCWVRLLSLLLILGLADCFTSPIWAKAKKKADAAHHVSRDAEAEPWTCVKQGAMIKVKGKNDGEKKDRCEAQMGIWQTKRHALALTRVRELKK